MGKIYPSILSLIGETPIVKLNSVVPETSAEIYVKLEFFNPGGSVKDRIARSMIEAAEKEGRLKAGDTIVEPTSGNTGVGLAMVGAAKGYPVIIVMPDTMSVERRKLIQAYGATLILTPGSEGMKGAIAKASELASQEHFFMPLQFDNSANTAAHRETTAKEIQEAFGATGLDAFVAGIGTGGTITGVGQELRRTSPRIKIYAVGILVGISAGAAIHSAIQVAGELGPDKKVLAIVPDNGERYLSTALYQIEE